jgi:hypothetical protein
MICSFSSAQRSWTYKYSNWLKNAYKKWDVGKKEKKKRNYYILKKLNKGIRALVEYARYIDKPMYILCETYLYVKKKVKLNVKFDKKKNKSYYFVYLFD